jgi:hypothetical protein
VEATVPLSRIVAQRKALFEPLKVSGEAGICARRGV